MRYRFASFHKGSSDVTGGVDPQDSERPISDIAEVVGNFGGHETGVHRPEFRHGAANHRLGMAGQDRHLLGAVVGVQRRGAPCGERRRACRERRRFRHRFANHQPRLYPVTAGERRDVIIGDDCACLCRSSHVPSLILTEVSYV